MIGQHNNLYEKLDNEVSDLVKCSLMFSVFSMEQNCSSGG